MIEFQVPVEQSTENNEIEEEKNDVDSLQIENTKISFLFSYKPIVTYALSKFKDKCVWACVYMRVRCSQTLWGLW